MLATNAPCLLKSRRRSEGICHGISPAFLLENVIRLQLRLLTNCAIAIYQYYYCNHTFRAFGIYTQTQIVGLQLLTRFRVKEKLGKSILVRKDIDDASRAHTHTRKSKWCLKLVHTTRRFLFLGLSISINESPPLGCTTESKAVRVSGPDQPNAKFPQLCLQFTTHNYTWFKARRRVYKARRLMQDTRTKQRQTQKRGSGQLHRKSLH